MTYSEPWYIPITKDIPNLRYIHNTTLNIFTIAPSWTFNTVLNATFFYRCYLTSRVPLRYLKRYVLDIFWHIQDLFSHM